LVGWKSKLDRRLEILQRDEVLLEWRYRFGGGRRRRDRSRSGRFCSGDEEVV
jgi:hypothetical protein